MLGPARYFGFDWPRAQVSDNRIVIVTVNELLMQDVYAISKTCPSGARILS